MIPVHLLPRVRQSANIVPCSHEAVVPVTRNGEVVSMRCSCGYKTVSASSGTEVRRGRR